VIGDGRGLARVMGEPMVMANELRRMAWERGVGVRVAIAGSHTAAWVLAHARPGLTVVATGDEASALARLPLSALARLPDGVPVRDALATLERWGLATLGDLARLPRAHVMSRLGLMGERLHQAAWGEDVLPLAAVSEPPRFLERVELEWPVDGLEPLSFVLARVCEALSASLERADRGAVTMTTRLTLVTKTVYERTLTLPAPMSDAKVLRTLILLDLEANPPESGRGIDVVEVELGVTPGRIMQKSLLAHDVPTVEAVTTLVARLQALMGESRVGSPVALNTHDPRRSSLKPFTSPSDSPLSRARGRTKHPARSTQHRAPNTQHRIPSTAIRRFRHPLPVRVVAERGVPLQVTLSERKHAQGHWEQVAHRAGPWRTSGQWWTADRETWDRDEWDVSLESGVIYRLARNRLTDHWEVEGIID